MTITGTEALFTTPPLQRKSLKLPGNGDFYDYVGMPRGGESRPADLNNSPSMAPVDLKTFKLTPVETLKRAILPLQSTVRGLSGGWNMIEGDAGQVAGFAKIEEENLQKLRSEINDLPTNASQDQKDKLLKAITSQEQTVAKYEVYKQRAAEYLKEYKQCIKDTLGIDIGELRDEYASGKKFDFAPSVKLSGMA